MKIENEIKQEAFRNVYHKLAVNLAYTHFWVLDHLRQQLRPYGISLQQYNILRILRGQHPKPSTINLLKERMLDKSSDASRLIERLRIKGLVERVTCSHDRRSVDILITRKGLEMLDTIGKTEHEFESALQNINIEDAEKLNSLLDKIRG